MSVVYDVLCRLYGATRALYFVPACTVGRCQALRTETYAIPCRKWNNVSIVGSEHAMANGVVDGTELCILPLGERLWIGCPSFPICVILHASPFSRSHGTSPDHLGRW